MKDFAEPMTAEQVASLRSQRIWANTVTWIVILLLGFMLFTCSGLRNRRETFIKMCMEKETSMQSCVKIGTTRHDKA